MTTRYRPDPPASRFTARAAAAGLLSSLGHRPAFAVEEFAGTVEFPDDLVANLRLKLVVGAGSLAADDVTPADRREIEGRVVEEVPVAAYCPACAAERAVPFPELTCPACGAPTPGVVRGRELDVFALEVET